MVFGSLAEGKPGRGLLDGYPDRESGEGKHGWRSNTGLRLSTSLHEGSAEAQTKALNIGWATLQTTGITLDTKRNNIYQTDYEEANTQYTGRTFSSPPGRVLSTTNLVETRLTNKAGIVEATTHIVERQPTNMTFWFNCCLHCLLFGLV